VTAVGWHWWRIWQKLSRPPQVRWKPAPSAAATAPTPPWLGVSDGARDAAAEAEPDREKLLPMVTTDLYQVSKAGTVNVVDLTLPHTLDIHEFDRLNESILALVRAEPEGQWVLDLSRLSYMGSAALGLMVNLRQQIKQSGGRLVLCGLSPQLLQIFKTCCMERLFRIVKTRADAIAAAA
jgi:anti-sigma B factor antagonist